MNNFSREIISDIHQLVSKAKAFENQLEPLHNLYMEVSIMVGKLEDLNAKVLDIETNIDKGGICADDLRQVLRDAFNRVTERELLHFSVDDGSLSDSFINNAESDVEVTGEEFDIQCGNEVILSDYNLDYDEVNWRDVAEDVRFEVDFNGDNLEALIDRVIDKACPKSQDVPSEAMEGQYDD